jgi:hypothetical protein
MRARGDSLEKNENFVRQRLRNALVLRFVLEKFNVSDKIRLASVNVIEKS